MTAAELIKELQQVHPNTEIKVVTDNGSKAVDYVARMGYNDNAFSIVPVD